VKSISIVVVKGFLPREDDPEAILSRTLRHPPDFVIVAMDGYLQRSIGISGIHFRVIPAESAVFERSEC
jgi:hypothetical protein